MSTSLHVKYLVKNNADRTIQKMSEFYTDKDGLKKAINEVTGAQLSKPILQEKRILIKPNWVAHSSTESDELCLRTHDNFLLVVLEIILSKSPSSITIGDAPIQGCIWDRMISKSLSDEITKLSNRYNIPIIIKDFRRRTYNIINNNPESEIRPLSEYLIFDLGSKSYIEPIIEEGKANFRVTNYDPDRMSFAHSPGIHKYCITRDFFDADIIISLPKIKTHQKAGITGALKNLVGINGDKDFLPHHRIGGIKIGGDCYPGGSFLRYYSELLLDRANRKQGKKSYWFWQKFSSLLWKLSLPSPEHNIEAGWYGNDTTWRMVMDLNIIAQYGNQDGTLSVRPHRKIFSLCDGIIAGQGNGPLIPNPLPLGVVSFTDNPAINDIVMATMMGFDYRKFSLLTNAKNNLSNSKCNILLNNKPANIDNFRDLIINTNPPKGWKSYLMKK